MMDVLFSDELKTCCFLKSGKSKKPGLPTENIQIMQGTRNTSLSFSKLCIIFLSIVQLFSIPSSTEYVDQRFGKGSWGKHHSEIKCKCNQKCIDKANKNKIKQEELHVAIGEE